MGCMRGFAGTGNNVTAHRNEFLMREVRGAGQTNIYRHKSLSAVGAAFPPVTKIQGRRKDC